MATAVNVEKKKSISPVIKNKKVISVFTLALLNVALVVSLRSLPMMAEDGMSLIFFYVFGALIFLIPSALISAELATGWDDGKGVFTWVKEAFGEKFGFAAMFLQWVQNIAFYPIVLIFGAGAFAFIVTPELAQNKFYMLAVILGVYWISTLINLRGVGLASKISSIGVVLGTLIPAAVIILLGVAWFLGGNPSAIPMDARNIIPEFSDLPKLALLVGALLTFAGMEVNAVHAKETKDPQKSFPKAMLLSSVMILVVFILGSLAVALIYNPSSPEAIAAGGQEMVAGMMVAFEQYFDHYGIGFLTPIFAILLTIGVVAGVLAWVAGPSKGLFKAGREGLLPPVLQKANKNGVQVNILLIQGAIVTAFALFMLILPSIQDAYWIFTALTIQLYLIMYILMYASALKLRYKRPDVKRAYTIPGGNLGMWIIAGIGITGAILGIVLGFIPANTEYYENALKDPMMFVSYALMLFIGISVFVLAPFVIHRFKKPSWKKEYTEAEMS